MNNYAISTADLADSLTRSSAALVAAGNSLEQASALTVAGNTILQDPESVGNALKVVSMRIRGVSSDLEKAGEETDGMITNTAKLQAKIQGLTGVNILQDNGAFKDTYTILYELGKAYENLDDLSRASLLELIAGKTRGSAVAAILQNYELLEEAYNDALDAEGSAWKENEKHLDSIQGKLDQFTNAVQTMWNNILADSWIKGFVSFGTIIIQTIDKIGLLITALIALGAVSMIKNKTGPIVFLQDLTKFVTDANAKIANFPKTINTLLQGTQQLTSATLEQAVANGSLTTSEAIRQATANGLVLSQVSLTAEEAKALLATTALNEVEQQNIVTKLGLSSSSQKVTFAMLQQAVATGKLTASEATQMALATGLVAKETALTAARATKILTTNGVAVSEAQAIVTALGLGKTTQTLTLTTIQQAIADGTLTASQGTVAMSLLTTQGAVTGLLGTLTALLAAIWPLLAIGAVVAVIDHFTTSAKEAAEAAEEALTTYQNAQDTLRSHKQTIESISADYKKLSKGVDEFGNNVNLSTDEYERYNEVVNQIADMFPQMVTGYTDEGNAILSLKGNVEELTKAYEEEARAARDAIIIQQSNIFDNFKNNTTKKGFWSRQSKTDKLKFFEDIIDGKSIKDYVDELGTIQLDNWLEDAGINSTNWFSTDDQFDKAIRENLKSAQAYYRQLKAEIEAESSSVTTVLNAYLQDDFDYLKLSDNAKNIVSSIVKEFDTEFYSQFDSASEMEGWVASNLIEPLQDVNNLEQFELAFNFQTKFNNNEISASEYQKAIDDFLDTLQKLGFSEDIVKSVKILFNVEDLSSKIESAKNLLKDDDKDKVTTLTKEDLDIIDKYKSRLEVDDDTLYSWDELKQKIEELKELDTPETSITDTLSSITALENAFNSLGDAVKEFKEDGTASVSTLKSLSELFSDIDGFEELYKILATGEGNIEEAITNVANAYIAQKDLLSDLTDEEIQIMVARLESLGVINAQEILLNRQTLQQELDEKLQGYNIDLSAYSTVEQAKEAIANAATINICSAVADMETELREKYGVNLSDFVSTEEAKVIAAKKAAKEIAKANKETAISNVNNDAELTERQVAEKQAEIEREYRKTISSIDSISTNVGEVVNSVTSTLDSYYNKTFKFDFSENKIGIGRDYADEITDKSSTKSDSALEKLKKEYENKISLLENQKTYIENEISRLEAEDKQVSRNLYEEQIKLEQQKLALYEEEREKLLAQMSTVAKNSDEWYEYADAIWEVEHSIQETTISVVELQKKIAQLYIDVFNKIDEAYSKEQSLHDKRIEALEDEIELLKLRNEYATISPETYNQLSAEEDAKIQSSKNEVERLKALLQKGIDENGEALTEEDIYDMLETIYEKEADIRQSEIKKEQYKQDKKQAYLDRFNNTSEAYDNLANVYQGNYDNAEGYKKYADLYGISVPKEILDYQSDQLEQQLQVTLNKKAELERQLAEAIASGDIEVGDSQWLEMVNSINDCTSAANDFQYQIAEVDKEIKALSVDKFNDIKDAFSNVSDVFNDRQSYIEEYMNYLEALGITVPAEMYEELIANEEQRQASNMASIERLRNRLAEMEANGYTAEDDEWVQAQADIRALEKEVLASETAMAQWNKTIQEMSFEKFDEFLKRIQDVRDELENVYGLISDEDVALEDGSWTEEGIMSLGLMTQKMEIAKQQAAEYAKEIEELEEEYRKGTMSEQDYYDRLMELKDGQWESINAYKDAKDAIIDINEARIDMIEQGIQKEIDAYSELIDLKKKELDAERDLYNFRKDIKSQTKDIATLERKIAAMSGSTDAATIAQRSKLEAQLREARESLEDSYYSHAIDSQNSAYDDELDSYTKSKEDYIEQLREALKDVEQIVADSMAQVLVNADSVLTGLNNVSSEYGVTLSDYLMLPWQNAALQATAYKESGILDLADFTDQTGIYSGIITEQINNLFGNGSLAAGLFQTSVEGVVESVRVTVNEATSPLTSDLQLPWQTVKEYAQNTFAPEVMYALQSIANDASGKKEQLTNDLIIAFQEGVNNAEEFNQTVIDALNDVINKSDDFADVVPSNVTAPSDDPWSLWSNNVQNLIQKIINKANDAVTAINNMNNAANNAQSVADTINRTGTSGGGSGNGGKRDNGSTKTSSYPLTGSRYAKYTEADVKALQNVLNALFGTELTVDGKLGPATSAAIKKAQRIMYQNGNETMKVQDGLYGVATRAAMVSYIDKKIDNLRGQGGSSMIGQGIQRYTDMKKTLPKAFYAKGTTGTSRDQWAITDEPQFGDELVLIPGASGNLSFMRKGTSVVPADITKRIFDLAQTPTNELGNNLIKVSIPNISTNNNIELTFDTLLKVENATKETIPELKKLVQEQLDVFARKLNYGIKRVGQ